MLEVMQRDAQSKMRPGPLLHPENEQEYVLIDSEDHVSGQ